MKQELDKMESMQSMQVISKLEQPTPWCAGMGLCQRKQGLYISVLI